MQPATDEVVKRQFKMDVCLGRGGFGEVYRAKMSSSGGLEAEVAVKVLRSDVDPAGQALQRLRDEGRMLARLNHPAILRVHDLVVLDGCVCLVTEYVEGEDVGVCFEGANPLPMRAVVEVVGAVASALAAAWTATGPDGQPMRLVHRDIKPSNIRISRHGQVKLLDFGIAKSDGNTGREAKTATNMIVGSPGYMAPERFLDPDVIPASDVFALGCVLLEGITHVPFFGDLPIPVQTGLCVHEERFRKHVEKQLAKLPASTPATVRELIASLLEYDPPKRPTAHDLAALCDTLGDSLDGLTLGRWARARKWRDVELVDGPLVGRALTEGTMTRSALSGRPGGTTGLIAAPSGTMDVPRPGGGAKIAIFVVLMLVLLLGVGALGVLALGGGGAALYLAQPTAPVETEPPAEVVPEPVIEPEPVVAPVDAPIAEPAVEPDAPIARPATRPPAAEPKPVSTPIAARADKVAIGFYAPKRDATAELVGAGATFALPASVEPGEYEIRARYQGGDPVAAGKVTVVAGSPVTVACNGAMSRCRVQ